MSKNGGYDWTRVRFLIFMTIRGKKCIPCVTHRLACIFYVEISWWMMRLQRGLTCSLSLYRRVSVTLRLVHVSDSLVCVSKRQVTHYMSFSWIISLVPFSSWPPAITHSYLHFEHFFNIFDCFFFNSMHIILLFVLDSKKA